MKEINIIFEIKNKENPYLYKGIATIENNVIRYKDDNSKVLFDITRNLLVKKDNEKIIKIDFDNKKMKIKTKNFEFDSNIDVLKIKQEKNIKKISYKIDKEEINLSIEITGGTYE